MSGIFCIFAPRFALTANPLILQMKGAIATYYSVGCLGTAKSCGQALSAVVYRRTAQGEAAALANPDGVIIGDFSRRAIAPSLLQTISQHTKTKTHFLQSRHRYDDTRTPIWQAQHHAGKRGEGHQAHHQH